MNESVPYIVHEGDMARMDRMNKRLWIAIILLVVLLVASNCGWLWYESQFEDEIVTTTTQKVTQTTEKGGNNDFVGGDKVGDTGSGD